MSQVALLSPDFVDMTRVPHSGQWPIYAGYLHDNGLLKKIGDQISKKVHKKLGKLLDRAVSVMKLLS